MTCFQGVFLLLLCVGHGHVHYVIELFRRSAQMTMMFFQKALWI